MGTVGGDWGWLRKGAGGGGSLLDVTRHTFVHAVVSTGRLVVLKPKKCPPAPKVPAKPPKPPTASKPGREPSSPTPASSSGGPASAFICLLQSPKAFLVAWPGSWLSAQRRLASPQQVRGLEWGWRWESMQEGLHRHVTCAVTQDLTLRRART